MKSEIKNKEMTLPPGLPELPPGTRYAGLLKNLQVRHEVFVCYSPGGEWVMMKVINPETFGSNFHIALPIESEAIPATPPVVGIEWESIISAFRLARQYCQGTEAVIPRGADGKNLVTPDLERIDQALDALITAARKGGDHG